MKKSHFKKIGEFLPKGEISHLEHKITQINRINQSFQAILPKEFQGVCVVANLNEGTLVIHCDSAAFASRLNLMLPSLIKTLQNKGYAYIIRGKIAISRISGAEKPYWHINPPDEKTLADLKKAAE